MRIARGRVYISYIFVTAILWGKTSRPAPRVSTLVPFISTADSMLSSKECTLHNHADAQLKLAGSLLHGLDLAAPDMFAWSGIILNYY